MTSKLATSPEGLSSLLFLPRYSDLQLVCGKEIFPVHKAIACSQSPVLAAAVDGDWMEAKINSIRIEEFDATTVRCMVCFMYGVDYESALEPMKASEDEKEKENQEALVQDGEEFSKAVQPRSVAILLSHINVNAIADYYDIPSLKKAANKRIQSILDTKWATQGFLDIVEAAYRLTGDVELQRIIAAASISHIDELVALEDFSKTLVMGDSLIDVMQGSIAIYKDKVDVLEKNLKQAETSLEVLGQELKLWQTSKEAVTTRLERVNEQLDAAFEVLNSTHRCRNSNCDREFNCYFERGGTANDPRFTLRCGRCRCRHK